MFDAMVDDTISGAVARQTQGIVAGLGEMEPGPFLAIVLSGIDLERLCGDDRITVMKARQRMASHYAAQTYEAMASTVDAYQQEEDPSFAIASRESSTLCPQEESISAEPAPSCGRPHTSTAISNGTAPSTTPTSLETETPETTDDSPMSSAQYRPQPFP